ncbi:MAG: hypothetical protein ACREJB_07330, partial [Planctomycetaceae bacterium]
MSSAQAAFDRLRPQTAWQRYFPHRGDPWDERKVAHLYRRAAFGASWDQLADGTRSTPDRLVEQLLRGGDGQAEFEADVHRLEAGVLTSGNPQQLKSLWLYRLLH